MHGVPFQLVQMPLAELIGHYSLELTVEVILISVPQLLQSPVIH